VLVKNAATQSGEFATCIAGLLFLGTNAFEQRRLWWLAGMLALALGMLANIFFVATGRTALVVILVLLVLFAATQLSVRGMAIMFAVAAAVALAGWMSSPYLRERTRDVFVEIQRYQATDEANSSGERIEFAKKSISFIREAPVIGHGTGSIVVGSLFNSHLFDFVQGWTYVLGVGVAGGMALKKRAAERSAGAAPRLRL